MNVSQQENLFKEDNKAQSTQTAKYKKAKPGNLSFKSTGKKKVYLEEFDEKLSMSHKKSKFGDIKSLDGSFIDTYKKRSSNRFLRTTSSDNNSEELRNIKIEPEDRRSTWIHFFAGLVICISTILLCALTVFVKIYGFKWKDFMFKETPYLFQKNKYDIDWELHFERVLYYWWIMFFPFQIYMYFSFYGMKQFRHHTD